MANDLAALLLWSVNSNHSTEVSKNDNFGRRKTRNEGIDCCKKRIEEIVICGAINTTLNEIGE